MTDYEAKAVLTVAINNNGKAPRDKDMLQLHVGALQHALKAIEDREALCDEYRRYGYTATLERSRVHMRGEPDKGATAP